MAAENACGFGQVGTHEPGLVQRDVGEPGLPQPAAVERGGQEGTIEEVAVPGVGVGERTAVEQHALVVLVRLQVPFVRDEIDGHPPTLPAQLGQPRSP
jgi:hypothetical protein